MDIKDGKEEERKQGARKDYYALGSVLSFPYILPNLIIKQ